MAGPESGQLHVFLYGPAELDVVDTSVASLEIRNKLHRDIRKCFETLRLEPRPNKANRIRRTPFFADNV
jgi:hypothetical protein